MSLPRQPRTGLTLLELTVVLAILVGLAAIVIPLARSTSDDARVVTTRATMKALRDAVLAYAQDMKGVQVGAGAIPGTTGMPATLTALQFRPKDDKGVDVPLFDPQTRRGWRGPYLQQSTGKFDLARLVAIDASWASYGVEDDPAFLDGWGYPIVLQWPTTGNVSERAQHVRLVSAGVPFGSNKLSVIDTNANQLMPPAAQRGNDLVLFVRVQDLYP